MRFELLTFIYQINFRVGTYIIHLMGKCPGKKGIEQEALVPFVKKWLAENEKTL